MTGLVKKAKPCGKVVENIYVADRYADEYQTDLFLGLKGVAE